MPYLDEGNVMPPPFNLIPPPKLVFQLCRRLFADPASCVVSWLVFRRHQEVVWRLSFFVASWLARSFLDRGVWVRALTGTLCCVLGQDTLLSQCLCPPRYVNGTGKLNAGGNPTKE